LWREDSSLFREKWNEKMESPDYLMHPALVKVKGVWTSSITFPQKVHRYITTDCFASNCNQPSQICCVVVTTVSVDIGLVADGASGL
jgi:hypothetical protein